jgi:hypothetical protein
MISKGAPGSAMKMAIARVATMTLPPPTAIRRSAPATDAASLRRAHRGVGGDLLDPVEGPA